MRYLPVAREGQYSVSRLAYASSWCIAGILLKYSEAMNYPEDYNDAQLFPASLGIDLANRARWRNSPAFGFTYSEQCNNCIQVFGRRH